MNTSTKYSLSVSLISNNQYRPWESHGGRPLKDLWLAFGFEFRWSPETSSVLWTCIFKKKKKNEPDEHWTLELFSDIIIDEAFYSTVHEQFKLNEA